MDPKKYKGGEKRNRLPDFITGIGVEDDSKINYISAVGYSYLITFICLQYSRPVAPLWDPKW